jgi:pimeloyl-ACP methyl ester carboxylesterase
MASDRRRELLVLLPGLDGTGVLFRRLRSALSHRDVDSIAIAYPERGFESHDALVGEVLRQIPSDRPFALLGESFGATIALKLAGRDELKVDRIILCAPPWRAPSAAGLWLVDLMMGWMMRQPFLGIGLAAIGMNGASSAARGEVADVIDGCNWSVLRARLALLAGLDMNALAARLRQPAMLITPSGDRLATRRVRNWPGKMLSIPGPHFILQAEPERCADAIAAFLDEAA